VVVVVVKNTQGSTLGQDQGRKHVQRGSSDANAATASEFSSVGGA
jgi:hypothetical protein